MEKSTKVEFYNSMIEELDQERAKFKESQPIATGTQIEVYRQVGKNMLLEIEYLKDRAKLVRLRDDAIGVSPGVQAYLNPKKIESKIDLDNGTAKIDNSLYTTGKKV